MDWTCAPMGHYPAFQYNVPRFFADDCAMSDLYNYFDNNPGRLIHKWGHYFNIYERHFSIFRGRPITLLEYGVFHGGSLQMWKHYFGPQARIIGVDINPRCAELAEPGIEIFIGDQEDPATHRALREKYGEFDIVLDDGGHTMRQQIITFEEMYPAVKAGGIYLAEDLHTSYFAAWGGAWRKPDTFIEYSKKLIDQLAAWYKPCPECQPDYITRTAYALHFYDSILVIEKQNIPEPVDLATGKPSFAFGHKEFDMLIDHDVRKGRIADAIVKCRRVLEVETDPARSDVIRKRIHTLEGKPG